MYETSAFLGWVQLHVLFYCCAAALEENTPNDSIVIPESTSTPTA
jgi:hypothetical protein